MAKKWDSASVADMHGKLIVITGANSGLGFESARLLACKGAELVLACRNMGKALDACKAISAYSPNSSVHAMQVDLQDLSSIRTFANQFCQRFDRLDVLMNNAGIMNTPYRLTHDGFESQMGTNHLGHFAITGLLLPLLISTPLSRVVTVTSLAHKAGVMDFDNLLFNDGHGYTPFKAYSRSKLANLLFTYELQKRFNLYQIDSLAVAAHPGAAQTELGRHIEKHFLMKMASPILSRLVQDAGTGALAQIRAAVDESVLGGEVYGPEGCLELSGHPVKVACSAAARNASDASSLWAFSETLTQVKFDFV